MTVTSPVVERDPVWQRPPGWHEIEAWSGVDDLWLRADVEVVGATEGITDLDALEVALAEGRRGDHPLPLRVARPGRCGDLLWTQGSPVKIASHRFVDALRRIGVDGFRTYALAIDHPALAAKYVGFAVDPDGGTDLMPLRADRPTWGFLVSDALLAAVQRAGAACFDEVRDDLDDDLGD